MDIRGGTPASVPGDGPMEQVIGTLRQHGPLSRSEISRRSGLAKSTVTRCVQVLVEDGTVVESPSSTGGRPGRPSVPVALNPDLGQWIGLDFGMRHVRAALVDVAHNILRTASVDVGLDYSLDQAVDSAITVVTDVTSGLDDRATRVVGVGAAVPGPVDPRTGQLLRTSVVPTWADVDVAGVLTRALGQQVLVDNDANCAARAELMWGAGRDLRDIVFFKLHSGVGGALVVDGKLVHGAGGVAGEFGHFSVDPNGRVCRCGGRGCLEAYVGIPALLDELSTNSRAISIRELHGQVVAGNRAANRIVADAGQRIGAAAASIANAVGAESVILGGTLAAFGDALLDPARDAFELQSIYARSRADGREALVLGTLDEHASALGAVVHVMSRIGLDTERHRGR